MIIFIVMFITGAVGALNDWNFYQMATVGGIYLILYALHEIKSAIENIEWKVKGDEEECDE